MRKKVVVLGSNFGGLTAALAVKHELEGDVDVTVVSPSDHFLFNPSLIWLPFGKRDREDITFPVAPTFETHDVDFVNQPATAIDLAARKVTYGSGETIDYDYLVIATGYRNDFGAVEGLGPGGNAHTITTLADAGTRLRLVCFTAGESSTLGAGPDLDFQPVRPHPLDAARFPDCRHLAGPVDQRGERRLGTRAMGGDGAAFGRRGLRQPRRGIGLLCRGIPRGRGSHISTSPSHVSTSWTYTSTTSVAYVFAPRQPRRIGWQRQWIAIRSIAS